MRESGRAIPSLGIGRGKHGFLLEFVPEAGRA